MITANPTRWVAVAYDTRTQTPILWARLDATLAHLLAASAEPSNSKGQTA